MGGAENITLIPDQIPEHTHPITDPGHAHVFMQNVFNGSGDGSGQYQGAGQDAGPPNGYRFTTGSPPGTREITNITGTDANITLGHPIDIRDSYKVLNYIIKC